MNQYFEILDAKFWTLPKEKNENLINSSSAKTHPHELLKITGLMCLALVFWLLAEWVVGTFKVFMNIFAWLFAIVSFFLIQINPRFQKG